MTAELVMSTHRERFYRALLERDWDALSDIYANDYMLVRPDGTVLSKTEVLEDLRAENLIFQSIELTEEKVRIVGPIAILTGQSRSRSRRAGLVVDARFRLIAVYTETLAGLKLLHFQSTALREQTV